MKCATISLTAALALACAAHAFAAEAPAPSPQWWERGQDTWYYKDDWKGLYLANARECKKVIEIPGKVAAAYAYVWGSDAYEFKVNGKTVGRDSDAGTIEDYDLKPYLVGGKNTLEILGGGEVICEGAAVLDSGKEVHFATDESWGGSRGVRTSPVRGRGPRGYAGDAHMARIVEVTAEQKAKALVNRLNSARVRILDQGRYRFWKHRDPREVLTLDVGTAARKTWSLAESGAVRAEGEIDLAAQHINEGEFDTCQRRALPACEMTETAEGALKSLLRDLALAAANRARTLGRETREGGGRGTFNGSRLNRLGWVASCEPLDSDPTYWEFDIAPPGGHSIALAGWWRFKRDPLDQGVAKGYASPESSDADMPYLYAPVKWGWERYGHVEYNANVKGWNKPYNGYGWYRKDMVIPGEWEGNDLVLRLGPRWNNVDWLAVNGQWVNDPSAPGSHAETLTIPARLVTFGAKNTLVLRVFNRDNIGGIINPGLRLSVAGKEPRIRRHPCGAGAAREMVFRAPAGEVTQIIYSSALSPAAVVATSGKAIRLANREERGFARFNRCTWVDSGQAVTIAPVIKLLDENWLLLWTEGGGPRSPRPLLMVLEKRPVGLFSVDEDTGVVDVELRFEKPGARIMLLRPFDKPFEGGPNQEDIDRCRLWSRALVRYPVGYLENLTFDGDTCRVAMAYEYLDLADDWGTEPLALAPLPMLFSYAVEHDWPGAKVEGKVTDLGCRARSPYTPKMDCGTYRAVEGASAVAYSFDRMEPKVRFMGAGTLGEEKGLGEPMYARMKEWGFNAYRPQTAVPAAADYADPERIAWFDRMLDLSRKHGLTCFVNWFTGQGVPEEKRADFIDRWVAMARHCKDLPEDAVVYDFINEPAGFRWDDYNAFMKEVTRAVRQVDKRHWISVEFGGGWAQPEDADVAEPTGDTRTIYQFHFYGPHSGDCHRRDLWYPRYQADEERFRSWEGWEERMLSPVRFAIRHRCQVMHGEFGISFLGPDDAPRRWLDDVLAVHRKYRMHWNWWNYSGRDIHRTGLAAGERVNPLVETLTEYATMPPPGQE